MSNFGDLQVRFYDKFGALITDGSVNMMQAYQASGTASVNRVGRGSFSVHLQSEIASHIKRGYYAEVVMTDAISDESPRHICTFRIRRLTIDTAPDWSRVTASGYDELEELNGTMMHYNVGAEFNTTLASVEGAGARDFELASIGSVTASLVQSPHVGEVTIDVDDAAGFSIGDDIVIQLGTGDPDAGDHWSIITNITLGTPDKITILDSIPVETDAGMIVSVPEIYEGDKITIDLVAPNPDHVTIITNKPGLNSTQIRDPLPFAAEPSAAISVTSGRVPATDDIAQIMANATGIAGSDRWYLAGNTGTNAGTSIVVDEQGVAVTKLLIAASEQTQTEFFRIDRTGGTAPQRYLDWLHTSDSSSVTQISNPQSSQQTTYESANLGIITKFSESELDPIYTHITPYGEDDLTIQNSTDTPPAGFLKSLDNGAWIVANNNILPDNVKNNTIVNFGIAKVSDSLANEQEAANRLQDAAVKWLQRNESKEVYYKVTCYVHRKILPGQLQNINYNENVAGASAWNVNGTFFVTEVTDSVSSSGEDAGAIKTRLTVSSGGLFPERSNTRINAASIVSGGSVSSSFSGGTGGGIGNDYIEGVITIGVNGEIRQGTGEWPLTFSGIRIYNEAQVGRIGTYFLGSLTGSFDERGLTLYTATGTVPTIENSLKFYNPDTLEHYFRVSGSWLTPPGIIEGRLQLGRQTGMDANIIFDSLVEDTQTGAVIFQASSISNFSSINLRVDPTAATLTTRADEIHFNKSKIISDILAADEVHEFRATGAVSHTQGGVIGVDAATFGSIRKVINADGGLALEGYTSTSIGALMQSWSTTEYTNKAASARGGVTFNSNLNGAAHTAGGNVFAILNNGVCIAAIDGAGNLHLDGQVFPNAW